MHEVTIVRPHQALQRKQPSLERLLQHAPCIMAQGDSRDLIKKVPTASVDFILTDPPYNLNGYSTGDIKMAWRKHFNNDVAEWDGEEFKPTEWASEFQRILKPTGNIFAFTSYNLLGKWHEAFDHLYDTFQFMVWHKTNPTPKLRRAGFLNSCELIVCMWNKGHMWNFSKQSEMHNFIETPICMGRERLKDPSHPTQKPLRVLRRLLEIASKPGDLVFDPFMGVGSTGVAALELDRRFLGVELENKYFIGALRSFPQHLPERISAERAAGQWIESSAPSQSAQTNCRSSISPI